MNGAAKVLHLGKVSIETLFAAIDTAVISTSSHTGPESSALAYRFIFAPVSFQKGIDTKCAILVSMMTALADCFG